MSLTVSISRSSMSIFFSWFSVILCMNIALKTGDLMRKSDKKFYLFQKFLPRAQNKFVTGQFHPIAFYRNVTEGSSLEEKIKIG